jgi:ArsR family transcriptional regulator
MNLLQLYKALADDSRLRILRILLTGRYNVNELVDILQMGQSRVSRHLKLLYEAGLAQVHRQGSWAYYESSIDMASSECRAQLEIIKNIPESSAQMEADEARRLRCLELRRLRSKEFHDQVAPRWSRLRTELFTQVDGIEDVFTRVFDTIKDASVVADLGCGTGEFLVQMAQLGHRAIGVDSSPAMLEQARATINAAGNIDMDNLPQLRLGMLEHLPLADGEADAVLLNMVLHHLADPVAVFREVKRSLTEAGIIIVCDLARHDKEWMREKYSDLWMGFTENEIGDFFEKTNMKVLTLERFYKNEQAKNDDLGIVFAVAQN